MASNYIFRFLFVAISLVSTQAQMVPIIVTTWNSTHNATTEAWDLMYNQGVDIVDSIVGGCSVCELEKSCGSRVGPGDKPDENGEVTQDAMIMDGRTMKVGSVGCLRRIKNAIGVAHAILNYTDHTILVGELAMEFAIQMGFPEEDLNTSRSDQQWEDWQQGNCQPNSWQNVIPDPSTSCGPYTPALTGVLIDTTYSESSSPGGVEPDHDTIGMIAIDATGNAASGTSTNGISHKIPGRVGDTPIPGAGSFAENGVGAAAATGNGDIMVRLLPSYHAVQMMSLGYSPTEAARAAITKIANYYPLFDGAVIAVNSTGGHGAACNGYSSFPYHHIDVQTGVIVDESVTCNVKFTMEQ